MKTPIKKPEEVWVENFIRQIRKEAFKEGYNQRLKDEGKTGKKYQHLYL